MDSSLSDSKKAGISDGRRDTPRGKYIRKGLGNMAALLSYLILALIIVILAIHIWDRVIASGEIVLAPFTVSGGTLKVEGTIPPKLFGAKLHELKSASEITVTGYGFLRIPLLEIPEQAEARPDDVINRLEGLKLKVKDVEIAPLIKAIRELLGTSLAELHGQITELTDSIEISCQLVKRNRVLATWRSSRKKESPPNQDGMIDLLVDDILFQFVYDLPRKVALEPWRKAFVQDDLPNWRALQAFTRGYLALQHYQQDLDYKALQAAQQHLERIQLVAPDYALGLYFYGAALAEDRAEAKAAEIFEQVQRISMVKKPIMLNAKLQQAASLLRLYEPDPATISVSLLEELIKDIKTELKGTGVEANDNTYLKKLCAIAYAQLAYTFGTMISIFKDPTYYDKVKINIKAAEAAIESVAWDQNREKYDAEFRTKNAAGYSLFRHAQYSHLKPVDFQAVCRNAIELLEEAKKLRPNHYEVLQNLAMIYDDEQFDSTGRYLDTAEALYDQTRIFVPNDYYQYERLARIQWRRMRQSPIPETKKVYAAKGLAYASQALTSRKNRSRDSFLLIALFKGESWKNTPTDDKARATLVSDANSSLVAALDISDMSKKPEKEENVEILKECAQFLTSAIDAQDTSSVDKANLREVLKRVRDRI